MADQDSKGEATAASSAGKDSKSNEDASAVPDPLDALAEREAIVDSSRIVDRDGRSNVGRKGNGTKSGVFESQEKSKETGE